MFCLLPAYSQRRPFPRESKDFSDHNISSFMLLIVNPIRTQVGVGCAQWAPRSWPSRCCSSFSLLSTFKQICFSLWNILFWFFFYAYIYIYIFKKKSCSQRFGRQKHNLSTKTPPQSQESQHDPVSLHWPHHPIRMRLRFLVQDPRSGWIQLLFPLQSNFLKCQYKYYLLSKGKRGWVWG